MNKQERLMVVTLMCINFTHIVDFMIMMPLGNTLIEALKINTHEFGLLVTSYTLSAGCSSFIASFFVDNFDRKKVLLLGFSGFLIGTFFCGIANSYYLLLSSRILAGVFGGLISAQVQSIVADVIPFERRASAMGVLTTAFSIASVVGVPLSLYFSLLYNWHFPFLALAGIGVLVVPAILKFVPSLTTHIEKNKGINNFEHTKNMLKVVQYRRSFLFSCVLMISHFLIIPYLAMSLETNVGFDKSQVKNMYLFGGIFSILTAPLIGKISDKIGKLKVFIVLMSLAIIPILLITHLTVVNHNIVYVITCCFFIFAGGRIIPAQAMVSGVANPMERGRFMNLSNSFNSIATGVASYIAATIIHISDDGKLHHYEYVGALSAVTALFCMWLGYRLFSEKKSLSTD
jgi:MFS transporter, DHA1 family, inner membrane transport protein